MNTHPKFKSVDSSDGHQWRVSGIILLVYFLLGLLMAIPVQASRLKTNWAQRVDLSEKVVRGQVVEVKSYWNSEKTLIFTDVTVLIDEYIKGNGPRDIIITIPGGTVDDNTHWVSDTPQFGVGYYGIIFLESSGDVTGGPDGVYLLQEPMIGTNQLQSLTEDRFLSWLKAYINGQTQISFEEVFEKTIITPIQQDTLAVALRPIIQEVSPGTISAGTGDVLIIKGEYFGDSRGNSDYPTIGFRYKEGKYKSDNSKIRFWSDKEIHAEVFTFFDPVEKRLYSPGSWRDTVGFFNAAGSLESYGLLFITFGYGLAKWANIPVPFYINLANAPTGGYDGWTSAVDAIDSAAFDWNNKSGAKFLFNHAGTTNLGYGEDGYNVISFTDLGNNTTIARTLTCFKDSNSIITEADTVFNTRIPLSPAYSPDKIDLPSVAQHELGHWLRLVDLYGHNDRGKAMYGSLSFGEILTVLDDDLAGIKWIYPGPLPPPGGTTQVLPSGIIGTTYPTFIWNAVSLAQQYTLRVKDSVFDLTYLFRAGGANCATGTGTCSATQVGVWRDEGEYTWWVRAWNNAGDGPWSNGMSFTVTKGSDVFLDVPPSYWANDYISFIYANGITLGCVQDNPNTPQNERRYCPEDSVTRGQMAAFIIRAKYMFSPPWYGEEFSYTGTPYFNDVPSNHNFFKYVQKLKDDNITVVSGTFGVNGLVTRGQMAAAIIRAKFGENFSYTTTPYFSDVPPTHNFFKYVQKLRDENITVVTGTYGVDNIVTRAQMAAFLSRAFWGL